MHDHSIDNRRTHMVWAGLVGFASGAISSLVLNPFGEATSSIPWWPDDLGGLLSVFSVTAGLIFGIAGGIFGRLRLHFTGVTMTVFFLSSVFGIAAAVYAALMTFDTDQASANFVLPYVSGSVVGALAMAVPVVLFARLPRPGPVIVIATASTTLWSVIVAIAMSVAGSDDALTWQWLLPLFAGWQGIFLAVIAWGRAEKP